MKRSKAHPGLKLATSTRTATNPPGVPDMMVEFVEDVDHQYTSLLNDNDNYNIEIKAGERFRFAGKFGVNDFIFAIHHPDGKCHDSSGSPIVLFPPNYNGKVCHIGKNWPIEVKITKMYSAHPSKLSVHAGDFGYCINVSNDLQWATVMLAETDGDGVNRQGHVALTNLRFGMGQQFNEPWSFSLKGLTPTNNAAVSSTTSSTDSTYPVYQALENFIHLLNVNGRAMNCVQTRVLQAIVTPAQQKAMAQAIFRGYSKEFLALILNPIATPADLMEVLKNAPVGGAKTNILSGIYLRFYETMAKFALYDGTSINVFLRMGAHDRGMLDPTKSGYNSTHGHVFRKAKEEGGQIECGQVCELSRDDLGTKYPVASSIAENFTFILTGSYSGRVLPKDKTISTGRIRPEDEAGLEAETEVADAGREAGDAEAEGVDEDITEHDGITRLAKDEKWLFLKQSASAIWSVGKIALQTFSLIPLLERTTFNNGVEKLVEGLNIASPLADRIPYLSGGVLFTRRVLDDGSQEFRARPKTVMFSDYSNHPKMTFDHFPYATNRTGSITIKLSAPDKKDATMALFDTLKDKKVQLVYTLCPVGQVQSDENRWDDSPTVMLYPDHLEAKRLKIHVEWFEESTSPAGKLLQSTHGASVQQYSGSTIKILQQCILHADFKIIDMPSEPGAIQNYIKASAIVRALERQVLTQPLRPFDFVLGKVRIFDIVYEDRLQRDTVLEELTDHKLITPATPKSQAALITELQALGFHHVGGPFRQHRATWDPDLPVIKGNSFAAKDCNRHTLHKWHAVFRRDAAGSRGADAPPPAGLVIHYTADALKKVISVDEVCNPMPAPNQDQCTLCGLWGVPCTWCHPGEIEDDRARQLALCCVKQDNRVIQDMVDTEGVSLHGWRSHLL